jgi:hypothetical protein
MLAAAAGRATGKLLRKLGIYNQVTTAAGEISRVLIAAFRLIGIVAILAVLGSMIFGARDAADEAGWISHSRDTTITAQSDWLVGESKVCVSFPLDEEFAKLVDAEKGSVVQNINCDRGPDHKISITFWGRIVRTDRRAASGVSWRCVKKSDSFTCYALN